MKIHSALILVFMTISAKAFPQEQAIGKALNNENTSEGSTTLETSTKTSTTSNISSTTEEIFANSEKVEDQNSTSLTSAENTGKIVPKKGVGELDADNEAIRLEKTISVDTKKVDKLPETLTPDEKTSKIVPKKGVDEDDRKDQDVPEVPPQIIKLSTTSTSTTTTTRPELIVTTVRMDQPPVHLEKDLLPSSHLNGDRIPDSTRSSVVSPQPPVGVSDPSAPSTSLVVGVIFAVLLISVIGFVAFKKIDAIKRRREYRRMNDFLIDGMYNDL